MKDADKQFDKRMMYFSLIDILFLPYFYWVTITYSFVFVIWWYYKRKQVISNSNKDFGLFKAMVILMAISALIGIVLNPSSIRNNVFLTLQFIVSFLHLYVYKYYFDHYSFELKKLLFYFVLFVTLVAVAYNFNYGLYSAIRGIWSPVQQTILAEREDKVFTVIRFGFLWMDENNIAYILSCVTLFLLCNEKTTLFEKLLSIVCTVFVLISSMSRGGLLSFEMAMGVYLVYLITGKTVKRKVKKGNLFLTLALSAILIVFVANYARVYFSSENAQASLERLEDRESDNRKEIYTRILNKANFIEYAIVGHGTNLTLNGRSLKPHSIHFFYIFAYGFIAYFIMMYILFRKRRQTKWIEFLWIFPFFFGATINIIIGEEKAMCIAMVLLAACTSPKYLSERRN